MLLSSAASWGQGAVTQVLEEVVGFTDGAAIRVNRDDEATVISQLDVVGSDFRACELTAAGLVCLQGADIYLWDTPAPLDASALATATGDWLFSCADANLPFDKKKDGVNSCTSATASAAGDAFVLGGKDNGKANEIVHIVKSDVCDGGYAELDNYIDKGTGPKYCFTSLAPGRPLIITLELTKNDSSLPPGVLVLEERTRATLVEFDGTSSDLGDSKDWGLSGNERLTGITALRLDESFGPIAENDFILGTTTKNRIIALSTEDAAAPGSFPVFDIQVSRDDRSLASGDECVFEGPQSPISTGFKSGFVYVTDGLYCDLLVLKPGPSNDYPFELSQETVVDTQTATKQFALEGVTAAPGITINLATCVSAGECKIVGEDIVLKNLQLASGSASSAIAYQIKNLPDCRYIPETCVGLEPFSADYANWTGTAVQFLKDRGVIVGDLADGPGGWQLNVKELLPAEVTDTVDIPDPFLISRFWRAPNGDPLDPEKDFIWEALFVDAKGVVVEDTFEITFDTLALVTSGLAFDCEDPVGDPFGQHVLTTVSENFFSGTGEYRDTMTNAPGCGSFKSFGGRTSLKPYSLVPTSCSVAPGTFPSPDYIDWDSDGVCTIGAVDEVVDDAVFMKTLLTLWGDFGDVLRNFACSAGDGQLSGQPLLGSDCNSLIPTYENGTDKLAKCWDALKTPKQSAGDQNCSAWLSQTANLRNAIVIATDDAPALISAGDFLDPANRKGELRVRIDVMLNLYYSRIVPFLDGGYVEP
jgi:hypothetical protein